MWQNKVFPASIVTLFYGLTYAAFTANQWTDIALPVGIVVICGVMGYLAVSGDDEPYTKTVMVVMWLLSLFFGIRYAIESPDVGPYMFMVVGSMWAGSMIGAKRTVLLKDPFWPVLGVSGFLLINASWAVWLSPVHMYLTLVALPTVAIAIVMPYHKKSSTLTGAIVWAIWMALALLSHSAWMMGMGAVWGVVSMSIFRAADWEKPISP